MVRPKSTRGFTGSYKTAVSAIRVAWENLKKTEKYGLEFGKVCYEWQQKLKTVGGVGNKGKGIVPTLEQLSIPESTAYWWIDRYKIAANLKQEKTENLNFNRPETRGFKDKPRLSLFLRRLMAIGAVSVTSPFPSTADYALKECNPKDAKAVIVNLDMAIERLKTYRKQFEELQDA
jgi:hypothetical protein